LRTQTKDFNMPVLSLSPLSEIRIQIEIGAPLLAALQKLSEHLPLTNEELFEMAAIKFQIARALAVNKRAGSCPASAPPRL